MPPYRRSDSRHAPAKAICNYLADRRSVRDNDSDVAAALQNTYRDILA
jgi:hypothetical protein